MVIAFQMEIRVPKNYVTFGRMVLNKMVASDMALGSVALGGVVLRDVVLRDVVLRDVAHSRPMRNRFINYAMAMKCRFFHAGAVCGRMNNTMGRFSMTDL
jgi:hypothetical protein